jgi:hypothetical protein
MEKLKSGTGLFGFKLPNGSVGTFGDKICSMDKIDPREYRPLDVSVSATLHDIRGHVLKVCIASKNNCNSIFIEQVLINNPQ